MCEREREVGLFFCSRMEPLSPENGTFPCPASRKNTHFALASRWPSLSPHHLLTRKEMYAMQCNVCMPQGENLRARLEQVEAERDEALEKHAAAITIAASEKELRIALDESEVRVAAAEKEAATQADARVAAEETAEAAMRAVSAAAPVTDTDSGADAGTTTAEAAAVAGAEAKAEAATKEVSRLKKAFRKEREEHEEQLLQSR